MDRIKRKITKEIFDRAKNGYLSGEDYNKVFSISEQIGYGVYLPIVKEENGEYFVYFSLGSSCD